MRVARPRPRAVEPRARRAQREVRIGMRDRAALRAATPTPRDATSSPLPRIGRDPQAFVPNIDTATAADSRPATTTVFPHRARPSRIAPRVPA